MSSPRPAKPLVEIETLPEPPAAIVKLKGELDVSTAPLLADAIAQVAQAAPRVVVDLTECTFADSSLVRIIHTASEDLSRRSARIGVVIPPEATAAQLLARLTKLAEIVPVYPSCDEALRDLRADDTRPA